MSELKAETIVPQGTTVTLQMYPKAETDKVIVELEESHKMEVEQLLMEIVKLKEKHKTEVKKLLCLIRDKENNFNRAFDSEEKELRRHKYKRCMAMARWCCDACDKWMMRKAKAIGLGKDGVIEYHKARSKLFHYMRWQTRWLKIAEQFKEGV